MGGQPDFFAAGMRFVDTSTDREATLKRLIIGGARMIGSDSASLYLLDHSTGILKPRVLFNIPAEYLAGCLEIPLGAQCCGRAALHKSPWIVEDMWEDPAFVDCRQAARASGMRSGFSVPVVYNDAVLGAVEYQFKRPHTPDVDELDRATLIAQVISYAVRRFGIMPQSCSKPVVSSGDIGEDPDFAATAS